MTHIKVPHFNQPTDRHCVPTCMKMVLDYTCKHFNIRYKVLSIRTIAKITKTNRDGTAPKAAENINVLLRKAKPPISFRYREGLKFPEIRKELDKGHPIIAFINMVELPRRVWHAVVIVDFDPENNLVYYDDPEEEEKDCIKSLEVGVFVRKWGWQARVIEILLTKGQTYIDGNWISEGVKT